MAVFADINGRDKWTIDLDAELIGNLRSKTGVDLCDRSGVGYLGIETNETTLVTVLKVLCAEQIERTKSTPEVFGRSIRGEVIPTAIEAIHAAAEDFFPKKRHGT